MNWFGFIKYVPFVIWKFNKETQFYPFHLLTFQRISRGSLLGANTW